MAMLSWGFSWTHFPGCAPETPRAAKASTLCFILPQFQTVPAHPSPPTARDAVTALLPWKHGMLWMCRHPGGAWGQAGCVCGGVIFPNPSSAPAGLPGLRTPGGHTQQGRSWALWGFGSLVTTGMKLD